MNLIAPHRETAAVSEPLNPIAEQLARATTAVAFTGAGISTESGISDFRSPGGVWSRYQPVYFDDFLASDEARRRYWRMKREGWAEFAAARPNVGHRVLAAWERAGRLAGVITQNIDGLHQDAGSRNVLELHGTQRFVACVQCEQRWPAGPFFAPDVPVEHVPACASCGGWLKPATVSFGQVLPQDVVAEAWRLAGDADVFLAIGSSLVVEPAASLPAHARQCGAFLAILNRDPTPLDPYADVVIREPIGATLEALENRLR